jgi:hypothetical protein
MERNTPKLDAAGWTEPASPESLADWRWWQGRADMAFFHTQLSHSGLSPLEQSELELYQEMEREALAEVARLQGVMSDEENDLTETRQELASYLEG